MAFRPSQPRLLWPALFGGALLKKAAIYGLARTYGIPRAYRRLLELERQSYPHASPYFRSSLRTGLKGAMRAPDHAVRILATHPAAIALLAKLVNVKGISDGVKKQMQEAFTHLIKATPGVSEAELWRRAKQEEDQHTAPAPASQQQQQQRPPP